MQCHEITGIVLSLDGHDKILIKEEYRSINIIINLKMFVFRQNNYKTKQRFLNPSR